MAVAAGNHQFAFNVYHLLRKSGKDNFLFSPFSLTLAMAVAYMGARGDTARQIADVLHFNLPDDELHASLHQISQALVSAPFKDMAKDQVFKLALENSMWVQGGYALLPPFLEAAKQYYDSGIHVVDFITAPEEARQQINTRIKEVTEGKISELLPPGAIIPLTRLVLTNAVYFLADWLNQFDAAMTSTGDFHLLGGSDKPVSLMKQGEHFDYAEGDGYQVIRLPYIGRNVVMTIILPDLDNFHKFENGISGDFVTMLSSKLINVKVDLTLPRFGFSSQYSMVEIFRKLGMENAFGEADFSGINGEKDLYISNIFHKTHISVDEAGTEAAAASAVVFNLRGGAFVVEKVEFKADHPFIFMIQEIRSGTILFLGRMCNPA